jgi:hypothetical protein
LIDYPGTYKALRFSEGFSEFVDLCTEKLEMLAGEKWVPSSLVLENYVKDRLREWAIKKEGHNLDKILPPPSTVRGI